MSGRSWLMALTACMVVAVASYFSLSHFLKRDLVVAISAALGLIVLFFSSPLFRVVVGESIRYPRVSSEIGPSESGSEPERLDRSKTWEVKQRK